MKIDDLDYITFKTILDSELENNCTCSRICAATCGMAVGMNFFRCGCAKYGACIEVLCSSCHSANKFGNSPIEDIDSETASDDTEFRVMLPNVFFETYILPNHLKPVSRLDELMALPDYWKLFPAEMDRLKAIVHTFNADTDKTTVLSTIQHAPITPNILLRVVIPRAWLCDVVRTISYQYLAI